MRLRQAFVLEAVRAVQDFLKENPDVLVDVDLTPLRAKIDAIEARLAGNAVRQKAEARQSIAQTATIEKLRVALRSMHMKPITMVARARLREAPDLAYFALPTVNTSSPALVTAARAMAEIADQYPEVLASSGLPADCVSQLRDAADALEAEFTSRRMTSGRAAGATASLAADEKEARHLLSVLDALIVPRVRADHGLLVTWRTIRKIRKKSGVPQGTTRSDATASEKPALTVLA